MPAGVGPAFVNLQFLRKSGYRNTKATAIMSAVWACRRHYDSVAVGHRRIHRP